MPPRRNPQGIVDNEMKRRAAGPSAAALPQVERQVEYQGPYNLPIRGNGSDGHVPGFFAAETLSSFLRGPLKNFFQAFD